MVGIARRRGCETCRKRKILCGLEQPRCTQCVKSNRECTGYRHYPVFVDYKIPTRRESISQAQHNAPTKASPSFTPVHNRTPPGSRPKPEDPSVRNCDVLLPSKPGQQLSIQINWKPAYRQQILQLYLNQIVPRVDLGGLKKRMWISSVPSLPYLTTALEVSIMSMCLAKMADFHGDQRFRFEGLELYHRALKELQWALLDPRLLYDDQTLGACTALIHYEIIQCPSDSIQPYMSHIAGCEKLIQLRGPQRHKEGLAHMIFSHFRVQDILYNLNLKQTSFLSESVWQEVPWEGRRKSAYDKVWDLLSFAPKLLREGELLGRLKPRDQLRAATALLARCWELDQDLTAVCDDFAMGEQPSLYWLELARNHAEVEEGIIFPLAFNFRDLDDANTVLMIWSTQAILWHGMTQLYNLLALAQSTASTDDESDLFDLRPLGNHRDYVKAAFNIFQSVEYCTSEEFLDMGPKSIAAPLRIAIDTLKDYPAYEREVSWGRSMMHKVQERSLRILSFYAETGGNDVGSRNRAVS